VSIASAGGGSHSWEAARAGTSVVKADGEPDDKADGPAELGGVASEGGTNVEGAEEVKPDGYGADDEASIAGIDVSGGNRAGGVVLTAVGKPLKRGLRGAGGRGALPPLLPPLPLLGALG